MLLNAAKYQDYSLNCFWVIKEKPTWKVKLPPPPSQIRVKSINENKNTTNKNRYFIKSSFFGGNKFFALVYTNVLVYTQEYYLLKGITKNYNTIVSVKKLLWQAIDSDINGLMKVENQQQDQVNIILLDVY